MKGWYGKAKRDHLKEVLGWTTDEVRPLLVTSAYTPSLDIDEFMADIPGGALITGGLGDALTSKTVSSAGVIDADDGFIAAVPAGQTVAALVIVQYTGSAATSRLWLFNNEAIPLPITTDGSDITLRWPTAGIAEI